MKTWTELIGAAGLRRRHRDALRLALQAAAASASAYWVIGLIGTGEAFLAVISAVLVLQTNRDETMEKAGSRLAGTAVGTAIGLTALIIGPASAGVAALAAVMLIMGAIVAYRPEWRYGIVAAAGLAVGSDKGLWETAQDRGIAIFVGALLGIAAGALILPQTAQSRARHQLGDAMAACRDLLARTLSAAVSGDGEEIGALHSRFSKAISAARDTAASVKGDERVTCYRAAVHHVERLWHALVIFDRVGETRSGDSLPLREASRDRLGDLQQAASDALDCLQRFERAPPEALDLVERHSDEIWQASHIRPEERDELQSVGLIFGLHEIARNLREIDRAVCAIAAAR